MQIIDTTLKRHHNTKVLMKIGLENQVTIEYIPIWVSSCLHGFLMLSVVQLEGNTEGNVCTLFFSILLLHPWEVGKLRRLLSAEILFEIAAAVLIMAGKNQVVINEKATENYHTWSEL